MDEQQQQRDAYGVLPEGALTQEDLAVIATRMLAKDAYIQRLRAEIERLRTEAKAQATARRLDDDDGKNGVVSAPFEAVEA